MKLHGGDKVEYCGKSLDGFEYAFSSLLLANGVNADPLPSLDCLSFRSFAFSGSGNVRDWFRPTAEWRFYLPTLAENLGCVDMLEVRSSQDTPPDAFPIWTLVGEAPYPGQRTSVRSKFYSGTPPFLLCKRVPGRGEVIVCDPMGGSFDLVEEDALLARLRRSHGFLASFHEPPTVHVAPMEAVLDQALTWREACGQGIAAKDFPFAEHYHGSTQEQISLHYGLMNGCVQMDKTIRFFANAGFLPAPVLERLMQMLTRLSDVWKNGRFELLHQLDETLWAALEKAR